MLATTQAVTMTTGEKQQRMLGASLHELGLSFRTASALENDKGIKNRLGVVRQVRTVRELLALRQEDILAIPNLGEKTLEEIYNRLAVAGFVRKGYVLRETVAELKAKSDHTRRQQLQRRLGYRLTPQGC